MEEILELTQHNIPFYAYGDNQAACEMADRLQKIADIINSQLESEVGPENSSKYVREGEVTRKTAAFDETILYIGENGDQVVIIYPTGLDDFVQVGNHIKLTLELKDAS